MFDIKDQEVKLFCVGNSYVDVASVKDSLFFKRGGGVTEIETFLGFDSDSEVTEKGFYFGPVTEKTGLYCNGSQAKVRSSRSSGNDCGGSISRNVAGLNHRKAQARIYVTGTSRGGDQHFAVGGFNGEGLRNGNNPGHHLAMTTSSSYRGYSGIGTGSSQGQEYGYGGFSGWYVYEIEYDNGTYTMTRYNDTQEVTPQSTYTHRKTFTGLAAAEYVGIWLRHGFYDENYNVADWFRFFEYVEEKTIRRLYKPNENTIAYFPFIDNFNDESQNGYSLTANAVNIFENVANVTASTSYLKLNTAINADPISVNFWYFFPGGTQDGKWKTFMAKQGGSYHHLLTPAGESGMTVGEIGFYNQARYGSGYVMTPGKWYNLGFTKNGTNQKIYVNGVKVMDSNSSFSNASNPIGLVANYETSQKQGPMKYLSEMFFERGILSDDDFMAHYNKTKKYYNNEKMYTPNEDTIGYWPLSNLYEGFDVSGNNSNSNGVSNIGYEKLPSGLSVAKASTDSAGFSIPGNLFDQIGSGDFTISYWLKPVGSSGGGANDALTFCLGKDTSPYYGPNIWYKKNGYTDGFFFFRFWGGNTQVGMYAVQDKNSFNHNAFHHICWTRIDGVNTGYIDGVQVCQAENSFSSSPTGNYGFIFSRYNVTSQSLVAGAMGSEFIFEKKGWTGTQVQDYVSKHKKYYVDSIKNYQKVEYIQSDGGCKINTGVIANQDIRVLLDFDLLGYQGPDVIMGTSVSQWSWVAPLAYNDDSSRNFFAAGSKGSTAYVQFSTNNGRSSLDFSLTSITLNDNTHPVNLITESYEITLFHGATKGGHGKIRSCKIYNGETLVRDFVPCYRKSDGVIGLFDTVEGIFYANTGTGTFLKGQDLPKYEYQVNENTVAYYPLSQDTQLNDLSSNEYNLTNAGGVTFGTYNGISCAHFSGGANTYLRNTDISFSAAPEQTVVLWFYVEGTNTSMYQVLYHIGQINQTGLLGSWYKHGTGMSLSSWDSGSYEVKKNKDFTGGWHCLMNITEGNVSKQYIDNELFQTFNNSLSNTQDTLCMGTTMMRSGSLDPSTNRLTGCLSGFIVENRAWTEKERTKHFEKLKSYYMI